MPQPDINPTLRRRRGYSPLPDGENGESVGLIREPHETDALHTPPETLADENVEEKEGWGALSWSFAASGAMTVGWQHLSVPRRESS